MYTYAKKVLDDYYNLQSHIDKMAVADALDNLQRVAENLVDALTDIVYDE